MIQEYSHMDDIIIKYLTDQASAEEQEKLNVWLQEDVSHQRYYDDFKKIWEESIQLKDVHQFTFDTDAAWEKVKPVKEVPVRKLHFRQALQWAAVFIVAIGATLFFMLNEEKKEWVNVYADQGNKTLVLPDSSIVTLAQGAELDYIESFGKTDRLLKLTGKAYFDVRHNAEMPFEVKASDLRVRVLGTQFEIDHSQVKKTSVSLIIGKVELSAPTFGQETLLLSPGETASFNQESGLMVKEKTRGMNTLAWKNKVLVFNGAPLKQVAEDLSTYFNVKVAVDSNDLAAKTFYGRFNNPELKDILTAIEETFSCKIDYKDGIYSIH